jgi:type II secretory pathway pseudopilin PulG
MSNQRALTLLELVIVVAIMAPITLSILHGLGQARESRRDSADLLAGLQSAQIDLDRCRIDLATGTLPPLTPGRERLTTQSQLLPSGRELHLQRRESHHADGIHRVSLVATFPSADAGLAPVRLATLAPLALEGQP